MLPDILGRSIRKAEMWIVYNPDKKRYETHPDSGSWKEDIKKLQECGWRFEKDSKTWHAKPYLCVAPLQEYVSDTYTAIQIAIDSKKKPRKRRTAKYKEPVTEVEVRKHICSVCKAVWECWVRWCKEPSETICNKCPNGLPVCFLETSIA